MKALTIKEPWATLIMQGDKKFEFNFKKALDFVGLYLSLQHILFKISNYILKKPIYYNIINCA